MGNDPGGDKGKDLEMILEAVYLYFKGDRAKVDEWLREPNSELGGESPMDLIRSQRLHIMVDLVRTMINAMP